MKKISLFLGLICLLLFSSCELVDYRKTEQVETPQSNAPPLHGEWKVSEILPNPHSYRPEANMDHFLDKRVFFSNQIVAFFEDYKLNPKYRTRKVELDDYLRHFYNVQASEIGLENREVIIVSVFGEDKMPYEVIRCDDDDLALYHQNSFFFLTKESEEVTEERVHTYMEGELEKPAILTESYSLSPSSGLLLGLRIKETEEDGVETYRYKSYWIALEERSTPVVLEMDDFILPRKRGFWKIDVERVEDGEIRSHLISASRVGEKENGLNGKSGRKMIDKKGQKAETEDASVMLPIIERVDYAGNDYISLQRTNYVTGHSERRLVSVDNLGTDQYVSFKALSDKTPGELISNFSLRKLEQEGNFTLSDYDYGMDRWNGHWSFFGRAQFDKDVSAHQDFYLNYFPPKEVVLYDEHKLSWSMLRSNFPDMTDAFSSPSDEFVVVRKANAVFVYPMDNRIIRDKILMKVELPEGADIILSEWAIDRNTESWTEFFLENGARKLSY